MMIEIGKFFDIYLDLDNQELVIMGRSGLPLKICVPVSYAGGYGKVEVKRRKGEKKKDFLKRAAQKKPPLIDIITRKGVRLK